MSDIADFFSQSQARIETLLQKLLRDQAIISKQLNEAINYSIFNGGKRFRPTLCYASAVALQARPEQVNCVAAAIELIHCYSLVHDDLPAMDNDVLRRGKPTCHIAFDEASAILAGDALQAFSFQALGDLNPEIPSADKLSMITKLAIASGVEGMAAGQALDLQSTNQSCSLEMLERMHTFKTGKIISACVDLSAIALAQANSPKHFALLKYSTLLGLAFQVKDDILDIEGSTLTLGKMQGADLALNKSTYPSLLGLEGAQLKTKELHARAVEALSIFGPEADLLRELSHYVIHRSH